MSEAGAVSGADPFTGGGSDANSRWTWSGMGLQGEHRRAALGVDSPHVCGPHICVGVSGVRIKGVHRKGVVCFAFLVASHVPASVKDKTRHSVTFITRHGSNCDSRHGRLALESLSSHPELTPVE